MGKHVRILRVIHSVKASGGGPIEGIKRVGEQWTAMGHEVHVASLDPRGTRFSWDSLPPPFLLGERASGYGRSRTFARWIRQHGGTYDAVVVSGLWQYHGLAVRKAMDQLARPYWVFPHGMLDPWFRSHYPLKHVKKWVYWWLAERGNLARARAVLFTSGEERRLAQRTFPGYRARERVVHYGAAGPPEVRPSRESSLREGFYSKPYILFLSRLHEKKGGDLLIRAFAREAPGTHHLVMAGPDGDGCLRKWQDLAAELGVADRVHWPGMLNGNAKWEAFHEAELFVLPSHQENFGIVLAEAMACGCPILTTPQVNIWRDIEEGGAGWAVPDTLDGIRLGLHQWFQEGRRHQRAEFGRDARQLFLEKFEIGGAARSLLQVFQEPVDHDGNPPTNRH